MAMAVLCPLLGSVAYCSALKNAQRSLAVAGRVEHCHLVGGHVAEADAGKREIGGNRVDDQPVAVHAGRPEVEEDRDLDELRDGAGQLANPVGREAEGESSFYSAIQAALPICEIEMLACVSNQSHKPSASTRGVLGPRLVGGSHNRPNGPEGIYETGCSVQEKRNLILRGAIKYTVCRKISSAR